MVVGGRVEVEDVWVGFGGGEGGFKAAVCVSLSAILLDGVPQWCLEFALPSRSDQNCEYLVLSASTSSVRTSSLLPLELRAEISRTSGNSKQLTNDHRILPCVDASSKRRNNPQRYTRWYNIFGDVAAAATSAIYSSPTESSILSTYTIPPFPLSNDRLDPKNSPKPSSCHIP